MGIKEVEILLDNKWPVYYPGQTLNGKIEYTLDAPKNIRGISITFKGHASTSFSRSESHRVGNKTHHRRVQYTGSEEYFHKKYYLIGSDVGEPMDIPVGKNAYPFSYQLPFNLPSSFEGELGYIRYTIKVTLDRPWKFDQDTKMAFTVVSNFDLNLNPIYRNPWKLDMEKSYGCCCCRSGHTSLMIRLPVSGFCSGQNMPLDVTCENNSSAKIKNIRIRLKKVITFRSHHPQMSSEVRTLKIAELSLGKVRPNMSLNWQPLLKIPPLPPSNLLHCSIIDVNYELKVTCSPAGCHADAVQTCPIFIGSIPLVGFEPPTTGDVANLEPTRIETDSYAPMLPPGMPMPMPMPGSPYPIANNMDPSAPPPPYDSIAQPSFQECQFTANTISEPGDHKDMRIFGRKDFAPRYPTYGFIQPPEPK